ncbi:DUF4335 domain-containing protein [Synechococcus sp. RSCCF101]|uniref:DUF4335 domain-containing protein n=1 Tax=Synechococcus sp. RSCCF101 TaxID=2511069 RepID=UPI0012478231|nr:DUF4335 domain-containing protein [Synechococcus sp. RSCCF101]QEY31862.1 DUF4335 domain-containing protein [Synechococcus sp. RSCCF101]
MIQRSRRYEQAAVRLVVSGVPDVSSDQAAETIGIVTGWTLELVGRPQLEGRREHLQALTSVVLPYARHLLSGVALPRGGADAPVSIAPAAPGHELLLRSSVEGTDPLSLSIDDGELADLVRCLDAMRLDPQLKVTFPLEADRPLPRRELQERVPLRQRLSAPVFGVGSAVAVAALALVVPLPRSTEPPAPTLETPVPEAGGESGDSAAEAGPEGG